MEIFTLRHEERYNRIYLDTPLNGYGITNSETSVLKELQKYNFNEIYTSPFLRCLQTITPYVNSLDYYLPVNIEYGFCEFLRKDYFTNKSKLTLEEDIYKEYNLLTPDNYYKPVYSESDTKNIIPEEIDNVKERVQNTLSNIISKYNIHENKRILICSHYSVISCIMNYFDGEIDINNKFLDIKTGGLKKFNVYSM